MRQTLFLIMALVSAPLALAETTVEEALTKARTDLADAQKRLGEARAEIAAERPTLGTEFLKVESELRTKRRQARLARMADEDRRQMMRELESNHYQLTQDVSWLAGLLKDHALKIQTQTDPGMPELAVAPESLAGASRDAETLTGRADVLTASVERLAEMMGGSSTPGEAIGPDGKTVKGTFVALGPESWFAAADGSLGGPAIADKSGAPPRVLPGDADAAKVLAGGGEAELALDFTGGKARSLAQATRSNPLDAIRAGGFWIWPILGLAVLALVFGIIKLTRFWGLKDPGEAWVESILERVEDGDLGGADQLAAGIRHPAGEVLRRAISVADRGADVVEEAIYEQLMKVKAWTGSMLPVIAVTAATAPLLGLLGTVSGMIRTFNLITLFGSGDPKPLAGGISEALVTTFFGLVVAIPALILHAFLMRRSQGILQDSERLGLTFVNGLRGDGEKTVPPSQTQRSSNEPTPV